MSIARTNDMVLTEDHLGRLFSRELLLPGVDDKDVVDGNDIDVLDALGSELIVLFNVARDLRRARRGETSRSAPAPICPTRLTLQERRQ